MDNLGQSSDAARQAESPRGRRRWWVAAARGLRDAWVGVGVAILVVAAAEGVARLVLAVRTPPPDRRIGADSYPREPWVAQLYRENARCAHVRWEPYVYWRRLPCSGTYINVDAAGLRRTWTPPARPGSRPLRIFFFGGSAAWGTGVRDEHTIPSELARYLAAAGIDAEVVNYGETGYVSTQDVIALLRELQRGHRPDVAIFYLGETDVAAARMESGVAVPMNESHRRREFNLLRHAKRLALEALRTVAAHSVLGRMIQEQAAVPPPLAAPPGAVEDLLRSLAVNVRAVRSLAASYGFGAEIYWEPSLAGKPHLTAYEERAAAEARLPRDWIRGVDERVRRAWAAAGADDLVYLGDLFAQTREPRFVDGSHTSEAANREVAAAIGQHLRASGRLRQASDAEERLPDSLP